VHLSAAQTVGPVQAGLDLYNNGFAAGIEAAVPVRLIIAIRAGTSPRRRAAGTGDGGLRAREGRSGSGAALTPRPAWR